MVCGNVDMLIPRDSSAPTKITSISPQTLCGPSDAEWGGLGSRDHQNYAGQMAIIVIQQKNFKKFLKIHFSLKSTHNLPQEGTWQRVDAVLVHNLSNDSERRLPYLVLGRIELFMTDQRGQALIRYGDPPGT